MQLCRRKLYCTTKRVCYHHQQARHSLAEQHKLVAEKNALIETVKRLNREVAKLEHFKRNLLQQLQDEEEVGCLHHVMASLGKHGT